jgi:hypothetical protein
MTVVFTKAAGASTWTQTAQLNGGGDSIAVSSSGTSDGPVEWCWPVPGDQAEEIAARFPDLTLRTEAAHQEASVRAGQRIRRGTALNPGARLAAGRLADLVQNLVRAAVAQGRGQFPADGLRIRSGR